MSWARLQGLPLKLRSKNLKSISYLFQSNTVFIFSKPTPNLHSALTTLATLATLAKTVANKNDDRWELPKRTKYGGRATPRQQVLVDPSLSLPGKK